MRKNKTIQCPVCSSHKVADKFSLECGNFDGSALYWTIKLIICAQCGHIYNELTSKEIIQLAKYYNEEYAPININAIYKTSGMPGGDSPLAFERYKKLFDFIHPYINKNHKILDVGCANGGFLRYLYKQGLRNLYGIDPTVKFIKNAKIKTKYHISVGSADSIPFKDDMFDVVVIDNVIEHLANPVKAIKEARRVLVDGGVLCVGAPDALNYQKASFELLWFLFKEHIQHFDVKHLELLAEREGFNLLTYREFNMPMTSKGAPLPACGTVFRLSGQKNKLNITKDCLRLKKKMEKYIAESFVRINKKRKMLKDLTDSGKPVYVYGIGAEFFYLYESVGLKNCNIINLIDINPYKQKTLTVDDRRIKAPSILKEASADSVLLICATIHTKEIIEQISKFSYRGKIIKI